ncbi:methylmalonyl Co-A mutase-associated GTPase MeaB [Epidermidibacterium keratini]
MISLVEDESPQLRDVAAELAPYTGNAIVIGITGSPGVGKSTSTSALVRAYRAQGKRVGVLAVDPSSPFSGGALLGDRIRMQDHATDSGVFIRSMSSRGHLGGLSWASPQALRVLDGAGFDVVLIETVGVGQAEVEIASMADTTLVLLAPGMGDGIQAAKAGILEVADIFVVNKADRDGADNVVRDLRNMLGLGGRHSDAGAWRPSIVKTIAEKEQGVDDVIEAIAAHRDWMVSHGELERRHKARAAGEVVAIAMGTLREKMREMEGHASLSKLADSIVTGTSDPYVAADLLVAELASAD